MPTPPLVRRRILLPTQGRRKQGQRGQSNPVSRPSHPELLYYPTQSWVVDDNFDLDYHVRLSALASLATSVNSIPVSRLAYHALTYAVRRKCIYPKALKVPVRDLHRDAPLR